MMYGMNQFNTLSSGLHQYLTTTDASDCKNLFEGKSDTLARIHKAVARARRQKKIEKLASNADHWKGLT